MEKEQHFWDPGFTSYGAFWLTLVAILLMPSIFPDAAVAAAPSQHALAWFFVVWGLFSGYMFVGTLKLNRALQAVFGLLTILFFLLAIRDFGGGAVLGKIAGWEGILTGLSSGLCRRGSDHQRDLPSSHATAWSHQPPLRGFRAVSRRRDRKHVAPGSPPQSTDPLLRVVSDKELITASEFSLSQVEEHLAGIPPRPTLGSTSIGLGATRAAMGLPLASFSAPSCC